MRVVFKLRPSHNVILFIVGLSILTGGELVVLVNDAWSGSGGGGSGGAVAFGEGKLEFGSCGVVGRAFGSELGIDARQICVNFGVDLGEGAQDGVDCGGGAGGVEAVGEEADGGGGEVGGSRHVRKGLKIRGGKQEGGGRCGWRWRVCKDKVVSGV